MKRSLPFALLPGLIGAAILTPLPVRAAERGFTITSFDRIRVEGPYAVTLTSGRGPSARATGTPQGLDAVVVRVEGRTLLIQRSTSAWTAFPGQDRGPVTIAVTAPRLVQATLAGSGSLDVDTMRDARIDLTLAGSGRLTVRRIDTDQLGASVSGSGGMILAGRAAGARVALRGSGNIDAAELQASDAIVTSEGSGDVSLTAVRTASVSTVGSGTLKIAGKPACTVRRTGSGNVTCGA
jgi:hypothetical protein